MEPSDFEEQPPSSPESFTQRAEKYAREDPWRALGVAFFAGLVLTLFPVGRIISTSVRLALALLRPLLLLLGAVKLYEEFDRRQR